MNLLVFKLPHISKKPYTYLTALALCISSYLCLVNLGYEPITFGEDNTSLIANNLLNAGTLTAWDGRNLASNFDGLSLNSNLETVEPPIQYAISALGIYLFGFNEGGVRSVHAFIGILTLVMLLLLLQQHIPNNARLRFLIFIFVCLSPQLLLFFRQARYYSFAVFSLLACIYFYEAYWRKQKIRHLVGMAIFGLLGFLNHYSHGAAVMLSIAVYHLAIRGKDTSKKQWLMLTIAALSVVAMGGLYCYHAGIITGDHRIAYFWNPYGYDFAWYHHLRKLWTGLKWVFIHDWLSWFICLWFLYHLALTIRGKKSYIEGFQFAQQLVLLGAIFFLVSVLVSVQRQRFNYEIDLRYSLAALPLFLIMKSMCIDWLMVRRRYLAYVALIALLISNIGAVPFNLNTYVTGRSAVDAPLISLIARIHNPYPATVIQNVADYLRKHAQKDELVYVDDLLHPSDMHYRETLQFYIGYHVLFCCQIDRLNSRLHTAVNILRGSLIVNKDTTPDWIIFFKKFLNMQWRDYFESRGIGKFHGYTHVSLPMPLAAAQLPLAQLYAHAFENPMFPMDAYVYVLKRNKITSH